MKDNGPRRRGTARGGGRGGGRIGAGPPRRGGGAGRGGGGSRGGKGAPRGRGTGRPTQLRGSRGSRQPTKEGRDFRPIDSNNRRPYPDSQSAKDIRRPSYSGVNSDSRDTHSNLRDSDFDRRPERLEGHDRARREAVWSGDRYDRNDRQNGYEYPGEGRRSDRNDLGAYGGYSPPSTYRYPVDTPKYPEDASSRYGYQDRRQDTFSRSSYASPASNCIRPPSYIPHVSEKENNNASRTHVFDSQPKGGRFFTDSLSPSRTTGGGRSSYSSVYSDNGRFGCEGRRASGYHDNGHRYASDLYDDRGYSRYPLDSGRSKSLVNDGLSHDAKQRGAPSAGSSRFSSQVTPRSTSFMGRRSPTRR